MGYSFSLPLPTLLKIYSSRIYGIIKKGHLSHEASFFTSLFIYIVPGLNDIGLAAGRHGITHSRGGLSSEHQCASYSSPVLIQQILFFICDAPLFPVYLLKNFIMPYPKFSAVLSDIPELFLMIRDITVFILFHGLTDLIFLRIKPCHFALISFIFLISRFLRIDLIFPLYVLQAVIAHKKSTDL